MVELILFVVAVLAAVFGQPLAEWLQEHIAIIDNAPVWAKRLGVALLVYGIYKSAVALGFAVNVIDSKQLVANQIMPILSSGLAYVFHSQNKSSES